MNRAANQRILIIDDEQDILELLTYNLEREGFEVSSAGEGEEALKKIREGDFDLVVLDLMLPVI